MKPNEITLATLPKLLNEHMVLAVINRKEMHGYQIGLMAKEISDGNIEFKHGTLYPLLHKLEKEGSIEGFWQDEPIKRKRKYYKITSLGKERLNLFLKKWENFEFHINNFFWEK